MAEEITPRFPPELLARYPHMFPNDIPIWERFLEKYRNLYSGYDYDVLVGEGRAPQPEWDEGQQRINMVLTKKRIDAIGHRPGHIDIIEVKPSAGPSAIGQIITYVELYRIEKEPRENVNGMIVTDEEIPDIKTIADKLGVIYVVLGKE